MLAVTFLGTSAARPTVERNVSALALVREGETLLFECGEGTQRQMLRYGVSFALSEIFFTHFHADHFLGVIGLIRTLGLQARAEPITLYGSRGAKKLLGQAIQLGVERVPFEVEIREVKAGDTVESRGRGKGEEYAIAGFARARGGAGRAGGARQAARVEPRVGALFDQRGRAGARSQNGVSSNGGGERRDDGGSSVCGMNAERGRRNAEHQCRPRAAARPSIA